MVAFNVKKNKEVYSFIVLFFVIIWLLYENLWYFKV